MSKAGCRSVSGGYFPPEVFLHNDPAGSVLDITRPPFGAKGDGISDDTAAFCAAMTFIREHQEPVTVNGKTMCSPRFGRNWIIYLPAGTYLVSGTVSQQWPAVAMNVLDGWDRIKYLPVQSPEDEMALYNASAAEAPVLHGDKRFIATDNNNGIYNRGQYNNAHVYAEINWNIRIFGEDPEHVVIKLADNTPGFGAGCCRPVLSYSLLERGSNVNQGNFLENVTINTGCGNPGAIALQWNSSNWGALRNVRLISGDGCGHTALQLTRNNVMGYCRDLLLDGFDTGIDLAAGRESMLTVEYSTIRNMHKCAVHTGDAASGGGGDNFCARKILIANTPLGISGGRAGQVIIHDSEFKTTDRIWETLPGGFCIMQSVTSDDQPLPDISSHSIPGYFAAASDLPHAADVPALPAAAAGYSVCVEDFGAAGDGRTDDTAAIQRAMDSGAAVIYFSRSNYVINGSVHIPPAVREITCFFATIQRSAAGEAETLSGNGIFHATGCGTEPLLLRQIITAGGILLTSDTTRSVVLEDIQVWFNHAKDYAALDNMLFPSAAPQDVPVWSLYGNRSTAGLRQQVFVTDCLGFAGDDGTSGGGIADCDIWARNVDTEHISPALYSFRNCALWMMGFKSENSPVLFKAAENSRLDILGGSFLNFCNYPDPVLQSSDSLLRACFFFFQEQCAPQIFRRDMANGAVTEKMLHDVEIISENDGAVICSY